MLKLRLGHLTGDPSSKYSSEHTNLSTEANVPTPRFVNSAVWPVPYACAQPYRPGSGRYGRMP